MTGRARARVAVVGALVVLGAAACAGGGGSGPAEPVAAPVPTSTTPLAPSPAAAVPTTTVPETAVGPGPGPGPGPAVEAAGRTAWNGVLPAGAVPVSATSSVPVALRIPALGIDAPIVPAGTAAADGGLELPADTTTVAWFRDGARPGASGSAVLAAHVDHAGAEGVFFSLSRLSAGSTFEIAFADGTTQGFVTTADAVGLPKSSLPIDEVFRRGGPAVVTLVTCGGRFDRATRSYEDNTVVTAVPV